MRYFYESYTIGFKGFECLLKIFLIKGKIDDIKSIGYKLKVIKN